LGTALPLVSKPDGWCWTVMKSSSPPPNAFAMPSMGSAIRLTLVLTGIGIISVS
jgi:hypothetical protein